MVTVSIKSTKRMIDKIKKWEGNNMLKVIPITRYTDEELKEKDYDELFAIWSMLNKLWMDQNQQ